MSSSSTPIISQPKRYLLKTLGCKANLVDTQQIEAQLKSKGWEPGRSGTSSKGDEEKVDLCIINSCTVTDEADRQSRKLAQRLAQENPHATVVLTGCGAEVDPEGFANSPGVDYVVGNQNKNRMIDLVLNAPLLQEKRQEGQGSNVQNEDSDILSSSTSSIPPSKILGSVEGYHQILSRHPHDREWPAAEDSFLIPDRYPVSNHTSEKEEFCADKTRAFLKIQEGCDSFCTYCIIPYGRGPSRSLRPGEVIRQVQVLVESGVREIVITGTNIGDYGRDFHETPSPDGLRSSVCPELGNLLQMILEETKLERLRVSSLDPTEITPHIIELMTKHSRFCAHFHVSLQSPHSRILRLMKRKYGFEKVEECLGRIQEIPAPIGGVFVGMDVITGFPGETDEEFLWGFEALSKLPWSRLHVFPYSERKGTPATRLPNSVPRHIRVERARKLTQLSLDRQTARSKEILNYCKNRQSQGGGENFQLQSVDGILDGVLLEKEAAHKGPSDVRAGWRSGYTSNYLRILIPPREGQAPIKRNQIVSVRPLEVMVDPRAHDIAFVSEVFSP